MDQKVKKKLDMMLINGEITPEQYKERINILTSNESNTSNSVVNNYMADTQQENSLPQPETKKTPIFLIVLLLLVGIGCLVGGGYFLSNQYLTPKHKVGDVMTNSIGMKMVWIPAGEFMMGYDNGNNNEKPVHKVNLSKGFWIGQYEVTQSQYEQIMGMNPSIWFKGSNIPAEGVGWQDAVEFCKKLSKIEGKTYTLPTEAQWEYACRAGTNTKYSFGDNDSSLADYAWYYSNGGDRPHPVGQKKPNPWGLYDMHGNVWEWCLDRYDKKYYSDSPSTDPSGPNIGTSRTMRGGSFCTNEYSVAFCRSSYRLWSIPEGSASHRGFRAILLTD